MKTKIISFANQKGGVGKSTLCIQAAFYLSELKHRVLVIDMDGQGNTSSRLAPKNKGGENLFTGTSTIELFSPDIQKIEPMKCECGADLIHTPKNDARLFDNESMPLATMLMPKKNLSDVLGQYDYVLIDCPPSLGRNLAAALIMSTDVVAPVKLSGFASDGVEGLLRTILAIRAEHNPSLNIAGFIVNDMDKSVSHLKAYKELMTAIPDIMFKNKIMHRPPLDAATSDGVPVWSLAYGHVAAKEIKAVLSELLARVGR